MNETTPNPGAPVRTIDLPLTIRHDLERLGLDNTSLVEADGGGCTLRFTHDQLTEFADRLGSEAIATANQIDRLEYRVEGLAEELMNARRDASRLQDKLGTAERDLEVLRKAKGCTLGHCAAAGLT